MNAGIQGLQGHDDRDESHLGLVTGDAASANAGQYEGIVFGVGQNPVVGIHAFETVGPVAERLIRDPRAAGPGAAPIRIRMHKEQTELEGRLGVQTGLSHVVGYLDRTFLYAGGEQRPQTDRGEDHR